MATFGGALKSLLPFGIGNAIPKTGIGAAIGQGLANLGAPSQISSAFSGYNPVPQQHTAAPQQTLGSSTGGPGGAYPIAGGYQGASGGQAAAPAQSFSAPSAPSGGGGGGTDPYLQQLQNAFGGARDALNSMLPTYDAQFQQYKTDAGNSINDAQNTLNGQVADITHSYGNNLKQALQTNNDIQSKTNNTYSALGTLDSSAYGNDITKNNQNLQDNINNINLNQTKDTNSANQTFTNFKNQIQSGINDYEQQINQAKAGVQQAIANADMGSAQSISNYINQLQSQQANLANMGANLKSSLAGLAAQGVNVAGNLKSINGADFSNLFGSQLVQQMGLANNTYQTPTTAVQGQGYINQATGQPYTKQQLQALGISQ